MTEIDNIESHKPNFIKLSPDLTVEEVDGIITIARRHRVHGFVCTNLTKKRDSALIQEKCLPEVGGISGKVVKEASDKLIKYVYQKTKGGYVIIGVGGIFSAEDAYIKIKNGASLVELISGMIFEGPQLIGEINRGLVALLKKDEYQSISDAVGVDAR